MNYKEELKNKYYPDCYKLVPDFSGVTLKLELTNICNHRCITCPHSKQTREGKFMNPKLARRLIFEAAELQVEKIALFLNGESFLVPDIAEYVRYCKGLKIRYIFLTTNGAAASKEQLRGVMEAGLDSLKFSINGYDEESYLRVHGRDDFRVVLENLRYTKQTRDSYGFPCRILAGCVLTDVVKDRLNEYEALIRPLVDDLLFLEPDNFGGYMVEERRKIYHSDGVSDPRIYSFGDKRLPCPLLFNSANVTCEGYLTLCCSEALNYMVTEDLNQMSLRDAWASPRMQAIRAAHLQGNIAGMQCANCMNDTLTAVKPLNEELYLASHYSAPGGKR